jgi:hypothetical protein
MEIPNHPRTNHKSRTPCHSDLVSRPFSMKINDGSHLLFEDFGPDFDRGSTKMFPPFPRGWLVLVSMI